MLYSFVHVCVDISTPEIPKNNMHLRNTPYSSTPGQKTLWWERLTELVSKERSHTPRSTNVQISYFEQATNFEHVSYPYKYQESKIFDFQTVFVSNVVARPDLGRGRRENKNLTSQRIKFHRKISGSPPLLVSRSSQSGKNITRNQPIRI